MRELDLQSKTDVQPSIGIQIRLPLLYSLSCFTTTPYRAPPPAFPRYPLHDGRLNRTIHQLHHSTFFSFSVPVHKLVPHFTLCQSPMILGLSVIIAFLSYLIYRRLCAEVATSTTGARGTRNNTFPAIPMWPFLSALLFQQPSPSTTVTSAAAKWPSYSPEPSAPVDLAVSSPDSTPKASPAAPTIQVEDIPQISLSAPTVRINVIDEDNDDGDDYVPSFPSINSAQRASGGISSLISSTSNLSSSSVSSKSAALFMPPPPIPIRGRNPKGTIRYASIPHVSSSPPSSASVLRQNPNGAARSRLVAAGIGASGVAAGNGLTLPKSRGTVPSEISKNRRKVILEPGHSPLDWARLQRSGIDLRVHSLALNFWLISYHCCRLTGLFLGSAPF